MSSGPVPRDVADWVEETLPVTHQRVALRERAGLSMEVMAAICNVPTSSIKRWEDHPGETRGWGAVRYAEVLELISFGFDPRDS